LKKTAVFIIIAVLTFTACGAKKAVIPDAEPLRPVIAQPQENIVPIIEMIFIPGGSFQMGSPRGTAFSLDDERPAHKVTLNNFYLGKYEVTQGQYFEVTGTRPSNFASNPEDSVPDGWKNLPVEMVNWYEALVFCNKLSVKERLEPVYRMNGSTNPGNWGETPLIQKPVWDAVEMIEGSNGYRLPTEAEWEYAARGGEGAKNFIYAGNDNANTVSWYYDNSNFKLHEVGKKSPNGLNLYDMSGNVMEWCWDWMANYSDNSQENPAGPVSGEFRTIRGGAWSVSVQYSRVAYRHNNNPAYKGVNLGFRVARSEVGEQLNRESGD
jgi:formylglycine-generating enzyme required for sulfatase activity